MTNPIRIIEIVVQGPQGPQGVPGDGIAVLTNPELGTSDSGVPSQHAVKTYVDNNEPNGFATIAVENQESIEADTEEVTLTVEAGPNITLLTHSNHKKLTIAANTQSDNNFTTDLKAKLVSVEAGADKTDAENVEQAGAVMDSDYQVTGSILVGLAPDPDSGVVGGPQQLPKGESGYVLKANETGIGWAAESVNIPDRSIAGSKLEFNAVDTNEIAADAVTKDKLHLVSTETVPSLEARGSYGSDPLTQKYSGFIRLLTASNTYGVGIKAPPEAAEPEYTLTLPNTNGQPGQVLKTDGEGVLDWVDQSGGGSQVTAGEGITVTDGTIVSVADDGITKQKLDLVSDHVGPGLTIKGYEVQGEEPSQHSGSIKLNCSDNSHSIIIAAPAHSDFAGNYTLTLPISAGVNGQVLKTNGSGALAWVNQQPGGAFDSQLRGPQFDVTSSFNQTQPVYSFQGNTNTGMFQHTQNSVAFSITSKLLVKFDIDGIQLRTAKTIDAPDGLPRSLQFYTENDTKRVSLKAPDALADNYTLILPSTNGTTNQLLRTDGDGVLDWVSPETAAAGDLGLNNKGDLLAGTGTTENPNTDPTVLGIGNDGQVLKADSNQPSGMIWADESGGSGGSDLTGGGTDKIFLEVENTMDENFATAAQKNYMSVGPLNIQDSIELTITDGSVMTFI